MAPGTPQPPVVSVPKGGGAMRGIGEKFAANPATGTGSLSIPVPISPGRSEFTPTLGLGYDSGQGNGAFGLGWQLDVHAVTRKTDKGIPRYRDWPDDEPDPDAGDDDRSGDVQGAPLHDTFLLPGGEDLVPVLVHRGGRWRRHVAHRTVGGREYEIRRYRPRVEEAFTRTEQWIDTATGESHWRTISRDGVTALYGRTPDSRIADPRDPRRVFSWLVCETYDGRGNAASYTYKAEDAAGVDLGAPHERHRTDHDRLANRYLKRVRYGNRSPLYPAPESLDADAAEWLFEILLDYGEHEEQRPTGREVRPWPCRPDPFSSYRSGFEIRTYRLCRRLVMLHHFADEDGPDGPVLSLELGYMSENTAAGLTMLTTVTHRGYRDDVRDGLVSRALPPLELEYSRAQIDGRIRTLDEASRQNLPAGLLSPAYRWVDLDGRGLSGALTEQADTWFYKENFGDGNLGAQRLVDRLPHSLALTGGRQELLDLDGDGYLDLVEFGGTSPGFSERTDGGWTPWRPFHDRPQVDFRDPRVRLVDLNGDGHADVLVVGDDVLTWYPSRGERGFGEESRCPLPGPGRQGAAMLFSDTMESLHLADMSGDGLADLVRVRNGEVCYWPSLGYGRFGAQVVMDAAPWLDEPDQFDPRRVRLADIDGSGTNDLVYLHRDGVRLYANRSGNAWAPARELPVRFPRIDSAVQVVAIDLLGTGTACLVWSSPLPGDAGAPLRYVDLLHDGKPHLLTVVRNNLGARTTVSYAPSTRFYLADKAAGRPWTTRAPFPVHVVERVETRDLLAHNLFTTRYAYHEIFFDGVEREFGGFALVEQWDAEEIGVLGAAPADGITDGAELGSGNLDPATHLPPVLTRSWFHTGARTDPARLAHQYANRYHGVAQDDGLDISTLLADPPVLARVDGRLMPSRLTPDEQRQAARALRGRLLRQEVYALDGSEAQDRPYSITTHLHAVELRQPAIGFDPTDRTWRPAVFAVYRQHTREEHHERLLRDVGGRRVPDPRLHDDVVLEVDEYLDVRRTVAIAHARRHPDHDPVLTGEDRAAQARARIVLTEHRFTNAVDRPDGYRTPLAAETVTYELTGLDLTPGTTDAAALRAALAGPLAEVPARDRNARPGAPARRLVERERSLFRRDDLRGPLPFGVLEPLALPWESYRLAFTPDVLEHVYSDRVDAGMLAAAGYVQQHGAWWAPSGRVDYTSADGPAAHPAAFAAAHFYQPQRFRDPFGAITTLQHDRYDLLVLATRDAMGNVVSVGERDSDGAVSNGNDYRVLQPRLVCDANGNLTEVGYDALGRITATAVLGKAGARTGDTLDGLALDPAPETQAALFAEPVDGEGNASAAVRALLGGATSRLLYDPDAFRRSHARRQPDAPVMVTLSRDLHVTDVPDGEAPTVQQVFAYSDGFARQIQHKVQAEPDSGGHKRWVGTAWTVFNNKGLPVRRYEAYFTASHRFEFSRTAGASTVLFYDPLGRPVATLHPEGSYDKRTLDPWRLVVWDRNDTVALDPATDPDVAPHAGRYLAGLARAGTPWRTWYDRRADGEFGPDERRAAEQTLLHAGTPARTWSDPLGRSFITVLHNRTPAPAEHDGPADALQHTRLLLDVQGRTLEIRDPLRRLVARLEYDLRGTLVGRSGIDSGPGASLPDVLGAPCLSWNARGYRFRTEYDPLHRPTRSWVAGPGIDGERQHQRTEYGEDVPDATVHNLRAQVHRQYDGAGLVRHLEYDVQGNLTRAERRLAADVRQIPSWSHNVPLDAESLAGSTRYDALNRPRSLSAPDGSSVTPRYSVAGLLHSLHAHLPEVPEAPEVAAPIVTAIAYNARGQRVRVDHGNGTSTRYEYDPETFRLRRTLTLRGRDRVQDLRQVYDPEGNVTASRDDAQQRLFFRNRVVDPGGHYVYDALYRLVRATGREHLGQIAGGSPRPLPPSARDVGPTQLHPHDGPTMARYVERYSYDAVGNLTRVRHAGADPSVPGWTRDYRYDVPSLFEPDRDGNRLGATVTGARDATAEAFEHDAQGNVTSMPGLRVLRWDPEDRLRLTSRDGSAPGDPGPETVIAAYGPTGARIRRAVDRARDDGERHVVRERVYLGPFERYREYDAEGAVTLERTTLHVLDEHRQVANIDTRTRGSDRGTTRLVRHQLTDHLGSSVVELDQQAQVISYEEYHPYGSTAYQAMSSMTEVPKRYRYTGRERDAESGLEYHGARYYAPWLGRWTSPDPAGTSDALSPYVYVSGNPVRLVDPSGHAGAEPRQLNLAETLTQEVIATRGGRGISDELRRDLQAVWEWWGGHGKVDAGHVGKAQWELRAGQRGLVAAQPFAENRALGVLERVRAAAARLSGKFARSVEGIDETVAVGSRFGRTARAAWRTSPTFRSWLRSWSAAAKTATTTASEAGAVADVGAAAGKGAEVLNQLELPFGQAGAVAKVEQTVASAAPAAVAVAETGAAAGRNAGLLAKAASGAGRVLTAVAPVLRVVGKVAGPLALGAGILQAATAQTTADKADAAINITSGALGLSANPVTGIAAGSIVAGGYVGGKVEHAVTEATGSRTAGVGAGTLAGAATGAAIGAVVGSIVPGVGTAIGAGVGATAGAIGGFVKSYWSSNDVPLFAGIQRT
ncbi:SpvB/TcaC N-terminal domain-containing protein [Streptomyces phaeochromogenes]|uniref:SpvB/TcaC N-terminal domain-containing protein n=1 Tax=Streptomyces phaeochromogenes TaxID=1923 RepID=UPI0033DE8ED7